MTMTMKTIIGKKNKPEEVVIFFDYDYVTIHDRHMNGELVIILHAITLQGHYRDK